MGVKNVEAAKRNEELSIGVHVRYNGTGSAGEVLALRSDDDGIWAKVDTTQLWYNSRYLELLDEGEYRKIKDRESKKNQKLDEDADERELTKKRLILLKKILKVWI